MYMEQSEWCQFILQLRTYVYMTLYTGSCGVLFMYNCMYTEFKSEDVPSWVTMVILCVSKQQKEIGMKIGRALGFSDRKLKEMNTASLLICWIKNKKKSEVATLKELTDALCSDQVGLAAVANELSGNIPSQKQSNL